MKVQTLREKRLRDTPEKELMGMISIKIPPSLLARVKAFRLGQPIPPTISETIRYLIDLGMSAHDEKHKKSE